MTREAALSEALRALFSADELVAYLRAEHYGEEVLSHLPSGLSAIGLCDVVVDALKRRGLLDREFFDRLEGVRPHRAADIRVVRRLWIVGASLEPDARWANGVYRVLSLLGGGGISQVWKAVDTRTDAFVALKILHQHHSEDRYIRQRFARGAAALTHLAHPAIVKVYSTVEQEGLQFFYVMEFIAGEPLAALVGRTPSSVLLDHILEIGGALEHVHAFDFLHRDVKPGNILITRGGKAKLIDFDLVSGDAFTATTTRNLGTDLYAPPEAHTSDTKTPAYDVYGLARSVEFVLRGRERTVAETRADDPVATLAASAAVKEVLRAALRPDPEERIQTIKAFCTELKAALAANAPVDTPTAEDATTPASASLSRAANDSGAGNALAEGWPLWLRLVISFFGISGGLALTWVLTHRKLQEGDEDVDADDEAPEPGQDTGPKLAPEPAPPDGPPLDPAFAELRPHQIRVVQAVEAALTRGQRRLLVTMPLGTGRVRAMSILLHRLLATPRITRALFLVDHAGAADQIRESLRFLRVEGSAHFADLHQVVGSRDYLPGRGVKVVPMRSLHQRIRRQRPGDLSPVEGFDCVVLEECHSDLAEAVLSRLVRESNPVTIGLTSTPAPSTLLTFGEPVAAYTHAQAVEDGVLVDSTFHRIVVRSSHDPLETFTLDGPPPNTPAFHDWTRAVCDNLAGHLNPADPGKTLVFAADSAHAQLVAGLLNRALEAHCGQPHGVLAAAITSADRSRDVLHRFRNESLPKIAVTANLSAGDIYTPQIHNLVFIRQVRSPRIFEHVLVQASRPHPGKDHLRIYDTVGLDIAALTSPLWA